MGTEVRTLHGRVGEGRIGIVAPSATMCYNPSMSNRATLNVSLTPEQNSFVAAKVKSGDYLTASEVIREALRLLQEQDRIREMRLDELRARIKVGLDQLDRGEVVDGKEVFKQLRSKMKKGGAHRT